MQRQCYCNRSRRRSSLYRLYIQHVAVAVTPRDPEDKLSPMYALHSSPPLESEIQTGYSTADESHRSSHRSQITNVNTL